MHGHLNIKIETKFATHSRWGGEGGGGETPRLYLQTYRPLHLCKHDKYHSVWCYCTRQFRQSEKS
jgi:hypothetical protein